MRYFLWLLLTWNFLGAAPSLAGARRPSSIPAAFKCSIKRETHAYRVEFKPVLADRYKIVMIESNEQGEIQERIEHYFSTASIKSSEISTEQNVYLITITKLGRANGQVVTAMEVTVRYGITASGQLAQGEASYSDSTGRSLSKMQCSPL